MPKRTPTPTLLLDQMHALVELVLTIPPPDENGESLIPFGEAKTVHARRHAVLIAAFAEESDHHYGSVEHMRLSDLEEAVADSLAGGKIRYDRTDTPEQAKRRIRARELAARLVAHVFAFGGRELKDVAPEAVKVAKAAEQAKRAEVARRKKEAEAKKKTKATASSSAKPAAKGKAKASSTTKAGAKKTGKASANGKAKASPAKRSARKQLPLAGTDADAAAGLA
jgi:hypothetical protein